MPRFAPPVLAVVGGVKFLSLVGEVSHDKLDESFWVTLDRVCVMNVKLLIDAVMRQTTVLIAELATAAGIRAPLSHVADQVFYELANELENQGVTRKVAADMFGLALRSYQLKVQRLEESLTTDDVSLWEVVFEYIRDEEMVARSEVLRRFHRDDEASVKSILYDLVQSGLVFQAGSGDSTIYRAATNEEFDDIVEHESETSAPWLAWVAIYRGGPIRREELLGQIDMDEETFEMAVDKLCDDGCVTAETVSGEDGEHVTVYDSEHCFIPMDEAAGWEAALFDHYNTVVGAICNKLRQLHLDTAPTDTVGGSTYTFDLWDGHPYEEEVLGLLRETRERVSELREKVTDVNDEDGHPDSDRRVAFYLGQSVVDTAPDENDADAEAADREDE